MSSESSDQGPPVHPDRLEPTGRAARVNLLLTGTIEGDDIVAPVKIRNLSETGALLEGAALPDVGAHLVLRRLNLEIGAKVVWAANSRCGIKFEGTISVAGWRSGSWIEPISSGQARVDEIQAAVRAGHAPSVPGRAVQAGARAKSGVEDADLPIIAKELRTLGTLLEDLGEQLSVEAVIVQKYPLALQNFDLACQILGHLADVLAAKDRNAAVNGIGMEELRSRLQSPPADTAI